MDVSEHNRICGQFDSFAVLPGSVALTQDSVQWHCNSSGSR